MQPFLPRLHLFEIDDQPWFPAFLRAHVQTSLTLFWTLYVPLLQPCAPATLVARKLQHLLDDSLHEYTFVDFCSGAGGPTCEIERAINDVLRARTNGSGDGGGGARIGRGTGNGKRTVARNRQIASERNTHVNGGVGSLAIEDGVDFILTDLHPHLDAWRAAAYQRPRLHYIPIPVDASAAPSNLPSLASPPIPSSSSSSPRKQFHIFSLAFHHFPDPLATRILSQTLGSAHGFAIFELQSRTPGALFTVLMLAPVLWAVAWWRFWGRWGLLGWIYVLPVVPFVLVFDGLVSCLRTREAGEIRGLVSEGKGEGKGWEGWRVQSGVETHTWPCGDFGWVVGERE